MLLHNSYYSDTGSQEILIFSPKTVQSLPHPVAMITFSVAMTRSLLGVNVTVGIPMILTMKDMIINIIIATMVATTWNQWTQITKIQRGLKTLSAERTLQTDQIN